MKRAVVFKDGRFLKLDGGFEYPEWTTFVQASLLPAWKAAAWAAALDGGTLSIAEPGSKADLFAREHRQVPVPVEEKAPDTAREGSRESWDPHSGSLAGVPFLGRF